MILPFRNGRLRLSARGTENLICGAVFVVSIWLRAAFPVMGLGHAEFDDMLFVRLAAHIRDGDWLGPYGNLTLAKGAAFSAFIAANEPSGIPFKLTEHCLYLCASWFFAASLSTLLRFRYSLVVLFGVLALNPVAWAPEVGGRLVRENLYTSLTLLLMGAAFQLYLSGSLQSAGTRRFKPLMAFLFGAIGGVFWLTREEGLWIVPALAVMIVVRALITLRGRGSHAAAAFVAAQFAFPVVGFATVVVAIDALNHRHYGVFRNNDFRSSDFQAAYGAISRIGHDEFARYVVFPKDARTRAYSVSSGARELESFFDGEGGRFWRDVGCQQTSIRPCDEILAGWFMWALRDAVAQAGHYRTAREAEGFYKALATELDGACDAARITCNAARHTLVPPWHPEFIAWTAQSARRITATLLTLGGMTVRIVPSVGPDENLTLIRAMTHETLGTTTDDRPEGAQFAIARVVTEVERSLLMAALPAGIVALMIALRLARFDAAALAIVSVLVAFATRVLLLAFLDATSIPSNSLLYLSPAVPLALVFGPSALMLWAGMRWPALRPGGANSAVTSSSME